MRPALRRSPTMITFAVIAAVVVALLPASPAAASTADMERDFHALINVERAAHGLGALTVQADIVSVARSHSASMARQSRLFHNPDYSRQITGWTRLSENIGVGPSVGAIHRSLMNSDGHRRNILDAEVTEIGIGVVVSDGRVWVTQNFRRPTGSATPNAPSSRLFGDIRSGSTHSAAIERVSRLGIADACGLARFCPNGSVTRGEFAGMLVRALDLPRPPASASSFTDVTGEQARDVEALYAAGLTNGCGDDRFCPSARLNREQMATFFARALELPPQPSPFQDVGRTHDGSIGALASQGIVNGCATTAYCPRDLVSRAQTASMLARNLG